MESLKEKLWKEELWNRAGKHRKSYNLIYGINKNPFKPYQPNTTPECFIFVVKNKNGEIGYLFDNNIRDGTQLWEIIAKQIEAQRRILYAGNAKAELLKLAEEFYGTQGLKTISVDPCWQLGDIPVYDLRQRNLISQTITSPVFRNAILVIREPDMFVDCKGHLFWTEYDPTLYAALQKVTGWKLNRGRAADHEKEEYALVATVRDGKVRVDIAFAEIVWLFHHGRLDVSNLQMSAIQNRIELSKDGLVIDHLTQHRANNFSWSLAAIPSTLNSSLSDRDRIAKPFYFLTVFDKSIGKFRVKFGNRDTGREYKFLFDDLASDGNYAALLKNFCERIGSKNLSPNADSFLRYWSDPEKAHDPDNMLVAMLSEPVETYCSAPLADSLTANGD